VSVPTDAEIRAACTRSALVPLEWATLTQDGLEFRVHVDEAAARSFAVQVGDRAPWLMRRVECDIWQPVAVLTVDGRWVVGDELDMHLLDQFTAAVPS
jgi:hypothetical protein